MQNEPQQQQPKKSSVWVLVAVVVGLAAVGVGLKVAADKDRAFCEAAYGKFAVEKLVFDASAGEWRIHVGGVANLGARLKSWEASYAGKTFSSADTEGAEALVNQYSHKAKRAGFLGSDFKKLYGAKFKHYTFPFAVVVAEGAPPTVELKGVVNDDNGEMPFKFTVELK